MSSLTSSETGARSQDKTDPKFRHPGTINNQVRNKDRPSSPADDSIIEIAPSEPSVMEIETVNTANKGSINHHPVAGPSEGVIKIIEFSSFTNDEKHRSGGPKSYILSLQRTQISLI